MRALLTAEEMQRWDRHAVAEAGIPERVLMESAGRAAARLVAELFPEGRVVGVVGKGSNGGDAVVALRCLRAWGREVAAVPAGGAEIPAERTHGWELPVVAEDGAAAAMRSAGVVLDGILGTGAHGAPREPQARMVREINAAGAPVLALDGPTGVDLTTGRVAGEAVRASVTVTFGAAKRGLVLHPGRELAGRVLVVEVGFPPMSEPPGALLITPEWAHRALPQLPLAAHKGTAGTLGIVAGHPGMGGAAILAAMGALRAGVGKARVVSPAGNRVALQTAVPEALFVDRGGEGVWDALRACDALLCGPGMGTDGDARELLGRILRDLRLPTILDADAITLLAGDPALLPPDGRERFVLTPHPGEMGRLLGRDTGAVVADPFAAAAEAAERCGCAVLLKGTPSVIAAPGEPALVNVAGYSGIATSGMGDTLGGVAGAFLAVRVRPRDAVALALLFAGRAAELAGLGRSVLPRDVAAALPRAFADASPFGSLRAPDLLLDLPAAY
jgi:NAD(P)H-hydrate epimerase